MNEADAAHVFGQVAEGLLYLHGQGIIHRDLKAENILLDDGLCAKVCDFGWCAEVEGRTTFCGTLCMLAPEMIQGKPYDRSVDIWSLGVLLFEMLCGSSPFDRGGGLLETCNNIVKLGLSEAQLSKVPSATRSLFRGLLHKEAARRISLNDALMHPWVVEKRSARAAGSTGPVTSIREPALLQETPMLLPSISEDPQVEVPLLSEPPAKAASQGAPASLAESKQPGPAHFFMGTGLDLKSQGPQKSGPPSSDEDMLWASPPTGMIRAMAEGSSESSGSSPDRRLIVPESIDVLPSPPQSQAFEQGSSAASDPASPEARLKSLDLTPPSTAQQFQESPSFFGQPNQQSRSCRGGFLMSVRMLETGNL